MSTIRMTDMSGTNLTVNMMSISMSGMIHAYGRFEKGRVRDLELEFGPVT